MLFVLRSKAEVQNTVLDIREILSNELFQQCSLERLIDYFSLQDGNSHAHEHIKNY